MESETTATKPFRISRAWDPLRPRSEHFLDPRDDIDMAAQQKAFAEEKLGAQKHRSQRSPSSLSLTDADVPETSSAKSQTQSEPPLCPELEACVASTKDRRAVLMLLICEARRFQRAELVKRGIDIDNSTMRCCPGRMLSRTTCHQLMQDIDILLGCDSSRTGRSPMKPRLLHLRACTGRTHKESAGHRHQESRFSEILMALLQFGWYYPIRERKGGFLNFFMKIEM